MLNVNESFESLLSDDEPWLPGDFLAYRENFDDGEFITDWILLALGDKRVRMIVHSSRSNGWSLRSKMIESPARYARCVLRDDKNYGKKTEIICFIRGER
jgi:hypothetical protein